MIAIALACQPRLLIADEPTTALDVTIRADIIDLLKDIQKEFGMAVIMITHDLGIVANIAKKIIVMYAGKVVETGSSQDIFTGPGTHIQRRSYGPCQDWTPRRSSPWNPLRGLRPT